LFTHSLEHLLVLVFSVATQIHMSGQSKRQENDETLPNFVKIKKAPKEGREKETKEQRRKSRQANSPTEAGHNEEREPLRTEPSTRPEIL
jgi:hypothetical protein